VFEHKPDEPMAWPLLLIPNLGESLATVDKHNTPLAEATTPSLEALKAYTTAIKVHDSKGSFAALPLFLSTPVEYSPVSVG
jgi:hypothetical protein